MKTILRAITKRLGVYEATRRLSDEVKWSGAFEYLQDAIYPNALRMKQGELELFKGLVPEGALCFDVGANIGDKSSLFVRHRCEVVAIEPVRRNIEILNKRFGRSAGVTILGVAVSDHVGREALNVTEDNTSFSSFSKKWVESLEDEKLNRWGLTVKPPSIDMVETTTLDLLIQRFGFPYYIKIDVEGHEINVLRGLTKAVPLVSFEANLPEFIDETKDCVLRLADLAPASTFNYTTEVQDRFQQAQWISPSEFLAFIGATDIRFMEIYCRMTDGQTE